MFLRLIPIDGFFPRPLPFAFRFSRVKRSLLRGSRCLVVCSPVVSSLCRNSARNSPNVARPRRPNTSRCVRLTRRARRSQRTVDSPARILRVSRKRTSRFNSSTIDVARLVSLNHQLRKGEWPHGALRSQLSTPPGLRFTRKANQARGKDGDDHHPGACRFAAS